MKAVHRRLDRLTFRPLGYHFDWLTGEYVKDQPKETKPMPFMYEERIDGFRKAAAQGSTTAAKAVAQAEGPMRDFTSGATRSSTAGKIDYKGFLSMHAAEHFGRYMLKNQTQADGKHRPSDNWKKGIPLSAYEESLFRHMQAFFKALEDRDVPEDIRRQNAEEQADAAFFNLQGWLHEIELDRKRQAAAQKMVG